MLQEARSPSFPILSRLLAGSAGLLLSLELAYRWHELLAGEPFPLPSYLRVHVTDALARYMPVRDWVTSHPKSTAALALVLVAAALLGYRTWLIFWRNQVIARVSGTYFKVDDGRFPSRPVDLIQEIARRPECHTFVGVTLTLRLLMARPLLSPAQGWRHRASAAVVGHR